MKAVRLLGNERVELVDVADPVPAEGEVLVKVGASLLCGSEMANYRADREQTLNGGHEPAGVVVDASRSRRWREGDRVGIHCVWGCGQCHWCQQGIYTWCDDKGGSMPAHAELIAAPDHVCCPIPDEFSDAVGALLAGDGLGVPYHTSQRLRCRGGDTVVVIGCGPIGLGNVLVQAFRGARVIAVDLAPKRLEYAANCGAAVCLNAGEVDVKEAVTELTNGRLAEGVVEATGKPVGFSQAMRLVGKGGTVACCGENKEVDLNVGRDLIRRDITVFGSWVSHFNEIPAMTELVRRGLAADRLVTHSFALSEAATAFAGFASGEYGKPALVP